MKTAAKATAAAALFCLALLIMAVSAIPVMVFGLGYWIMQCSASLVDDIREQRTRQAIADRIAQLSGRGML